jgi:plastocyanin
MNTMKTFSRRAGVVVGAMIFASALPGFAATTSVLVGPSLTDTFSPNIVNINVGDQIIWTWQATFHSTTSGTLSGTPPTATPNPNGIWDSGVVTSLPHSFTNSFPSAGNFPFFCSIHYNFGMTGQVNVAAVALPPTVSITNPVNNATFSAPASFTLAATAASSGGSVTNVQFFQGATSLGNATTSPYSVLVNSLAAADYTFSAVASDNSGLTATNAVTIHVVTPVAIVLSAPQFLPPADFRFNYTANSGLTYVIQRSSSLSSGSWTTLSTNVAGGSPVLFDDPAASGNPGFYRVGRMPNP